MWEAKNYINGAFVSSNSDSVFDIIDPCNEEPLGIFFNSTKSEVDEAYNAARDSLAEWKALSRVQRAEYLYEVAKLIERRRDELAFAISYEPVKTIMNP